MPLCDEQIKIDSLLTHNLALHGVINHCEQIKSVSWTWELESYLWFFFNNSLRRSDSNEWFIHESDLILHLTYSILSQSID